MRKAATAAALAAALATGGCIAAAVKIGSDGVTLYTPIDIAIFIGDALAGKLDETEQKTLQAKQVATLAAAPDKPVENSWKNEQGTKTAKIVAKPAVTKKAVAEKAKAQKAKAAAAPAAPPPDPLLANLNEKFAELPEATACRETTTSLETPDGGVQDVALYCQGDGGEFVRVAGVSAGG